MICWGSRSRTQVGELPRSPPLAPTPEPESVGSAGTQPSEGPRGLVLLHFRAPSSTIPIPLRILSRDLEVRWRRQLEGVRDDSPFQNPVSPSLVISAQDSGIQYPNSTQSLRLLRVPNSWDSGVPAPASPQDHGVRALHPKNSGIRVPFPFP